MARLFARVSSLAACLAAAALTMSGVAAAGDGYRRDDGNVAYNAYNSHDGWARRRGYWDRPGDRRWRGHRHHRHCGHRGHDGHAGYGGFAYYPGHGYAQVVVEPHGHHAGCDRRHRRYRGADCR